MKSLKMIFLFFSRSVAFAFICFVFLTHIAIAQSNLKPDDLCGEWWTPENDGKILFYKNEGKYFGKVVWIKNPNDPETGKPRLDKKNPNPALRHRPIQNLVLFYDFEYSPSKEKYINGKLYDSNTGNTYSCWIKLITRNVFELHGYIGVSLIGKSVYFTRVQ